MPIEILNVRDLYAKTATQTIKVLVVGPPGSGKTLTASTWPQPLYADIEGRLLSVRHRDVIRARIDTVHDLEELKAMLDQPADVRSELFGRPVETVVIDTVDELARLMIRERLQAEKQEAMRQQDWGWLGDNLRHLLRGYRNLEDLNVVFNVHVKSVEDGETGRIEKRPDIQGSVGNEIAAYVDEAFLLVARPTVNPKTGERIVERFFQTYQDPHHQWIKDHSGTLPQEFPLNFIDDYSRLAGLIFADAPTPSAPAPARVSSPVAEVTMSTSAPVESEPARRGRPRKKAPALVEQRSSERQAELPVEAEPAVEAPPEPEPEPVEPVVESVPAEETKSGGPPAESEPEVYLCEDCGQVIDNRDIAEVAEIRYGVRLCRADFAARRAKK